MASAGGPWHILVNGFGGFRVRHQQMTFNRGCQPGGRKSVSARLARHLRPGRESRCADERPLARSRRPTMTATTEQTPNDYADLTATLSLPEKVTLLTGASVFTMAGHAGIGLTPITSPTARRASAA